MLTTKQDKREIMNLKFKTMQRESIQFRTKEKSKFKITVKNN